MSFKKSRKLLPDHNIELDKIRQPLLSFSVALIYLFLMVYVFYDGYTGIDHKEDFVNCTCHGQDRKFYIALFVVFSAIWSFAVLGWSILVCIDLYRFW